MRNRPAPERRRHHDFYRGYRVPHRPQRVQGRGYLQCGPRGLRPRGKGPYRVRNPHGLAHRRQEGRHRQGRQDRLHPSLRRHRQEHGAGAHSRHQPRPRSPQGLLGPFRAPHDLDPHRAARADHLQLLRKRRPQAVPEPLRRPRAHPLPGGLHLPLLQRARDNLPQLPRPRNGKRSEGRHDRRHLRGQQRRQRVRVLPLPHRIRHQVRRNRGEHRALDRQQLRRLRRRVRAGGERDGRVEHGE
mmetsp:Transcript_16562/g.42676  ORF Transcript_16562/g.42676 Transcript_16562/m.42676 type:complete len:243 (-) Transcript_16562:227-955(-)